MLKIDYLEMFICRLIESALKKADELNANERKIYLMKVGDIIERAKDIQKDVSAIENFLC